MVKHSLQSMLPSNFGLVIVLEIRTFSEKKLITDFVSKFELQSRKYLTLIGLHFNVYFSIEIQNLSTTFLIAAKSS